MLAAYVVSRAVRRAAVAGRWAEIRGYGAIVDGVQRWPNVPLPVVGFIGAWVALTVAMLGIWLRCLR